MEKTPSYVQNYLHLTKRIQDAKNSIKEMQVEVKKVTPQVQQWLQRQPDFQFQMPSFTDEESMVFGQPGKIRIAVRRTTESMSQTKMRAHLFDFFTQLMPDHSSEECEDLAQSATQYVYSCRKTVKVKAFVSREYPRKKKRKMEA